MGEELNGGIWGSWECACRLHPNSHQLSGEYDFSFVDLIEEISAISNWAIPLFVSPCLVLSVASWGSVSLAVFFFIVRMEISLFLWKIYILLLVYAPLVCQGLIITLLGSKIFQFVDWTVLLLWRQYLQARHGTRGPTKKRIKELEKLAKRLHEVAAQAGNTAPAWMRDWKSPWEGKKVGGDLLPIGEEEMYYLAQRYRNNYTEIFEDDYHPETYPIITTQVVINLCLS